VNAVELSHSPSYSPVQHMLARFDDACTALSDCITVARVKYFSDAAEALNAFAKIHNDKEAEKKARVLKLLSYKKAILLAQKLRPNSPKTLLQEHGFTKGQAELMRRMGKLPDDAVPLAVALPRPPAPTALVEQYSAPYDRVKMTEAERRFQHWSAKFSNFTLDPRERFSAKDLARIFGAELDSLGLEVLHDSAQELAEWLDEFLQYLPKPKRK
jgi:hypothetical protein